MAEEIFRLSIKWARITREVLLEELNLCTGDNFVKPFYDAVAEVNK